MTENKENVVYIYALVCPDTQQVRYIGKTINPKNRMYGHINSSRSVKKPTKVMCWVNSLLKVGKKPIMKILHETDNDNWEKLEIECIAQYRATNNLCNILDGGLIYVKDNNYVRKKMSEAKKGKPMPQHVKEKLALANKDRIITEATRAKMRETLKRKRELGIYHSTARKKPYICTQATKERISKTQKARNYNMPEDSKRKMSEKKVIYKLLQYDKKDIFIKEWNSAREAALSLGLNKARILVASMPENVGKTFCGGFMWKRLAK